MTRRGKVIDEKLCVPDIGDIDEVEVIDILVEPGSKIDVDQTIVVLESDKATMDIPAQVAGIIKDVKVKKGDKVSQGSLIVELQTPMPNSPSNTIDDKEVSMNPNKTPQTKDIYLPDLGTDDAVSVIALEVAEGQQVEFDQTILTLESDKASMDVPAPYTGIVQSLCLKIDDKVRTGDKIGSMTITATDDSPAEIASDEQLPSVHTPEKETASSLPANDALTMKTNTYAGPAARKLARDLGLDITQCQGTGKRGRITLDDVCLFGKKQLEQNTSSASPLALSQRNLPDFSKFGTVSYIDLKRIKQKTAQNLQATNITVPQVTQFDKADITDLEEFRQQNKAVISEQGGKLTMIIFVMKALVASLKKYPQFNTSLSPDGKQLVQKHFYHIAVAVDTPNGLVVPVIQDVDKKSILELSQEIVAMSQTARKGQLKASQMQGSSMTISSLGGIGGTAFTPIVNWPDVAILGLSASQVEPFYNGNSFEPRSFLPLSLSYDHRVIDGAEAARFIVDVRKNLEDMRRVLFV